MGSELWVLYRDFGYDGIYLIGAYTTEFLAKHAAEVDHFAEHTTAFVLQRVTLDAPPWQEKPEEVFSILPVVARRERMHGGL